MASQTETLVHPPKTQKLSIPGIPRNVRTEVAYYTEPADGKPLAPIQIKDSKSRSNRQRDFTPVTVYDVRGSGVDHTLDTSGIQFVKHKTAVQVQDFFDEEKVKEKYYPELSELLYKL